jgi:trimeric autotransporter adhesin
MKISTVIHFISRTSLLLLTFLLATRSPALAQDSTGVYYQGKLTVQGLAAQGLYDMRFQLWDDLTDGSPVGAARTNAAILVEQGLFSVLLDWTADDFTGGSRWLELGVRTNASVMDYTILSPRQPIASSPHALVAGHLSETGLAGEYSAATTLSNPLNYFSGSFEGDGSGLSNVEAATLGGQAALAFWQLKGNSGTVAGTDKLGTTDNQPLELQVNGKRALRLEPAGFLSSDPNVIGGAAINFVDPGVSGATIAGGGAGGFGFSNRVSDSYSFIGGGYDNWVLPGGDYAVIGGGFRNWAGGRQTTLGGGSNNEVRGVSSTVGGGEENTIEGGGQFNTIAGGFRNHIPTNAIGATISGGVGHVMEATDAVISGGQDNSVTAGATHATVGGGWMNLASGSYTAIGGGEGNMTASAHTTIGGGQGNWIQANSGHASIGGGHDNLINDADQSTVAGGNRNQVLGADYGFIGGGFDNLIYPLAHRSVVSGGSENQVQAAADHATIGGGDRNVVGTNGTHATIAGGQGNRADGAYAIVMGGVESRALAANTMVAGRQAVADHEGSMVLADATDAEFHSSSTNEFSVRSTGGVRFVTGLTPFGVPNAGVKLDPGATAWSILSDRRSKKDIEPANETDVLEALSGVPMYRWRYRWESNDQTPHLGPMAQDFKAAFFPGRDQTTITTLEFDGVALAAIKGLHIKLQEKDEELKKLQAAMERIEERLADLER